MAETEREGVIASAQGKNFAVTFIIPKHLTLTSRSHETLSFEILYIYHSLKKSELATANLYNLTTL